MIKAQESSRETNKRIVDGYFDEGLSLAALAAKYGRNISTVSKLVKKTKLADPDRLRQKQPRDPRVLEDMKPIGMVHTRIGLYVERYINENKLSPTGFGCLGDLGFSRNQVRHVTMGCFDLTITQIQRLSRVLGIPYDLLVSEEAARQAIRKA